MSRRSKVTFYPSAEGYVMRWKPSHHHCFVARFSTPNEAEARKQAVALLVEAINLLRGDEIDRQHEA